jgi:hypothetical protein
MCSGMLTCARRLVMFELAQIRHAIRAEKELSKGQSYSILWATPGNRKRMRCVRGLFVGVGVGAGG